jgi:hypothetical protein
MNYLRLVTTAKTVAALVALFAIPAAALWLLRPLLGLAEDPACIASARARTRFVFRVASLPALTAILLIIPFRVPRELVEVVILPVVVTVIGIAWLQAGAWRVSEATTVGGGVDRRLSVRRSSDPSCCSSCCSGRAFPSTELCSSMNVFPSGGASMPRRCVDVSCLGHIILAII